MGKCIPSRCIGRVDTLILLISYESLVSQADILTYCEVSFSQSVAFDVIAAQQRLDLSAKLKPVFLGMLNINIQSKVSSKSTLFESGIVFDDINGNLSSYLRVIRLVQVYNFHSCSALIFKEQRCYKIPSCFEMLMAYRYVEFPIWYFMIYLILCVPVHSTLFCIQFNKAIVAERLIDAVL